MLARHVTAVPHHDAPDPIRIAALSAALLINAAVALLLLRPLDWSQFRLPLPAERQLVVELIPRITVPPPIPAPPPPVPRPSVRSTRVSVPVAPLPQPLPVQPAIVDSMASIEVPAIAVPATDAPPMPAGNVGASVDYAFAPPPPYPAVSLRRGSEGTVWLRVEIDAAGTPMNVDVEHSSGDRALDAAARAQVLKRWRFKPAMLDGTPVRATALVPVVFSIGTY